MGKQTSCGAVRAAIAACVLLCAPLALGGCAAPSSYAGIPLAAGAADPELQSLARRAQAGDKQAQLELGIRYEEGRGIPRDRSRAKRLYRRAAATIGGTHLIYIPASGRHGRASTVPVSGGKLIPGLPEAAARLAALSAEKDPQ